MNAITNRPRTLAITSFEYNRTKSAKKNAKIILMNAITNIYWVVHTQIEWSLSISNNGNPDFSIFKSKLSERPNLRWMIVDRV